MFDKQDKNTSFIIFTYKVPESQSIFHMLISNEIYET